MDTWNRQIGYLSAHNLFKVVHLCIGYCFINQFYVFVYFTGKLVGEMQNCWAISRRTAKMTRRFHLNIWGKRRIIERPPWNRWPVRKQSGRWRHRWFREPCHEWWTERPAMSSRARNRSSTNRSKLKGRQTVATSIFADLSASAMKVVATSRLWMPK